MVDMASFLAEHADSFVQVSQPVNLDDVGALTAQSEGPIVFNDIVGYPGWRLVDQLFVDRDAQARVLNCDASEVVPRLAEVMRMGPSPLRMLDSAPCQEEVYEGSEVDLAMLPIVTHTDLDPYPYSTSFAVHRDPVSGAFNQMFPRSGVLSRNEMVTSFVSSTANRYLAGYAGRGEKMPQAIAIGGHPAWELAGCYSHPHDDWWEAELFEAISGHEGEVVNCRTVPLVVPADASVVIEGWVNPQRSAPDGPSPGPSMLFLPYAAEQPVFEVTAITMRSNPIYRNHQMTPFTDHQEMPRLFHEAIIYDRLVAMGIGVRDVHFPQGGGALSVIIQVEPTIDGQVTDALLSVLGSAWMNTKLVIAVDPDIDIYDYRDVHLALATRVDPSKDVITIGNARGLPFDPSAEPVAGALPTTEETRFPSTVGKWGIDATKPVPYRAERRREYERAWPKNWGKVSLGDYV